MSYPTFHIRIAEEYREMLSAMLDAEEINGVQELEEGLLVYLKEDSDPDPVISLLDKWKKNWPLQYQFSLTANINWNAEWEANFKPILVEDYVGVRADFHELLDGVEKEIVIQPKMAFGTGHHATTWMMMYLMRELPLSGTEVLDYGTGTGILAILAAMEGTKIIHAVDIEQEAYENTLENAQINGVSAQILAYEGQLDDVPQGPYDIILANINRNVILDSLPALYQCLKTNGFLLLSGLLLADGPMVKEATERLGFKLDRSKEREGWLALQYRK